jgi:bacteriocin-like protein
MPDEIKTNATSTPPEPKSDELTTDELKQVAGGWSVDTLSQMGGGGSGNPQKKDFVISKVFDVSST